MNNKKLLLLLAAVGLTLAGCGNSSSDVSSVASSEASSVSSAAASSSTAASSTAASSSSVASSEDESTTTVVTKVIPSECFSASAAITEAYDFNSVFGVTPGVNFDTGSGKNITVDGTTFASGGRIKLNGAGSITAKSFKITATTAGTLRFACTGANSSDTSRTYTIAKEDGTEIFTSAEGVVTSGYQLYSYDITEAGTYYLYSNISGINFYYLDFTQVVKLGTATGIVINTSNATSDYLIGETFSSNGLTVSESYSSGAKVSLDASLVTVDSSAFDSSKAGTYTISVKYKTFTAQTYDVKVHSVAGIKAYTDATNIGSSGSKNVNRTVKVYKVGDTISADNVVVKAYSSDGFSKKITLTPTLPATTAAKEDVVSYVYKNSGVEYKTSYKVEILDASKLAKNGDGAYQVNVDSAVTANGQFANNAFCFNNVQDAHDFLKTATADTDSKVINISAGTYNEKLYLEIPNLKITSSGSEDAVIQYNAKSDTLDSNGVSFSTYGSSSVTVQDTATNFVANNIKFNNSLYSTMAEYKADSGNLQACALVTRSPSATFLNCKFDGFQDTLYMKEGQAAFKNCTISGMTDFIFGESNDAYFYKCSIICKDRGDTKNNGYIVAHKPAGTMTTGYVFDTCSITGETGIAAGTVSLARSWGANAKVTYMNCTMDSCVSTSAYPCTANNSRFEAMSGNLPTKSDYQEYNNSGEGAISAAVAGGKIMTETEYNTFLTSVTTLFTGVTRD